MFKVRVCRAHTTARHSRATAVLTRHQGDASAAVGQVCGTPPRRPARLLPGPADKLAPGTRRASDDGPTAQQQQPADGDALRQNVRATCRPHCIPCLQA